VDTREKSLKLAYLTGWRVYWEDNGVCSNPVLKMGRKQISGTLAPYNNLAQFAAIFLKHPDVMERFVCTDGHTDASTVTDERYARYGGVYQGYLTDKRKPTQENILDEILRMNGETLD
jgi:hypothetical protein